MAKKRVLVGAPAYMGLYTSLMTILLAFFILLTTMTPEQDAGFKAGMGKIRNAFGLKGGFGLLQYVEAAKGILEWATAPPEPENSFPGTHRDAAEGLGGGGNTEAELEDSPQRRYMRLRIPVDFARESFVIPREMADYLDSAGAGLIMFDYRLAIRCYANDTNGAHAKRLATRRATAILRYLHRASRLPLSKLEATGYDETTYIATAEMSGDAAPEQLAYIYVFSPTQ